IIDCQSEGAGGTRLPPPDAQRFKIFYPWTGGGGAGQSPPRGTDTAPGVGRAPRGSVAPPASPAARAGRRAARPGTRKGEVHMGRKLWLAAFLGLALLPAGGAGGGGGAGDDRRKAMDTVLIGLEAELRVLLQDHGADHPKVKALKNRIDLLRAEAKQP